ncbi:hypothetical protein F5B20DRAFT_219000 [Whalleya microplaca]|nr:hypothetical protein F5B20DRAFT_219000 [Whalleya microplaca]
MALTSITISSWTPPPPASMLINDCSATTDWVAAALGPAATGRGAQRSPWQDGELISGVAFLNSTLPDNWTQPTYPELAAWYIEIWNQTANHNNSDFDAAWDRAWELAFSGCDGLICQKLGWRGDPDVTGIGMMISYYVAAAAATVYFIVLIPSRIGVFKSRPIRSPVLSRLVEAFQESIHTFLDTALIFAVAMLGAAIVRYASVIRGQTSDYSVYRLIASVFMSAYTIFPALILQTAADGLRGRFLRQFLWALIIGLTLAVDVLYEIYLRHDTNNDFQRQFEAAHDLNGHAWQDTCQDQTRINQLKTILRIGHIALGVNVLWWLYYFVASTIPPRVHARVHSWQTWTRWERYRPWLRALNGALLAILMWVFVVWFNLYRNETLKLSNDTNEDKDWSFGQVLALATWSPVFVDLAAVFIYGPERGLSEKLSRRYEVIHVEETEHNEGSKEALRYEGMELRSYSSERMRG